MNGKIMYLFFQNMIKHNIPSKLGQCHAYWCPGSSCHHDISRHDIDCMILSSTLLIQECAFIGFLCGCQIILQKDKLLLLLLFLYNFKGFFSETIQQIVLWEITCSVWPLCVSVLLISVCSQDLAKLMEVSQVRWKKVSIDSRLRGTEPTYTQLLSWLLGCWLCLSFIYVISIPHFSVKEWYEWQNNVPFFSKHDKTQYSKQIRSMPCLLMSYWR